MWDRIARYWWVIPIVTGTAAGGLLLLHPVYSRQIITGVVTLNLLVMSSVSARRYLLEYRQGILARQQVWLLILGDLLGLVLVLGVASFMGSTAGVFAAMRAGPWVGIGTGLLTGFASAWLMGRIVRKILRTHQESAS